MRFESVVKSKNNEFKLNYNIMSLYYFERLRNSMKFLKKAYRRFIAGIS